MLLIIVSVVAVISISGMSLAYDVGINGSTGIPNPQYSSEQGGGMAISNYDLGINGSTGMPRSPAATKSLGSSNGIEPYNPGINGLTGMPASPGTTR